MGFQLAFEGRDTIGIIVPLAVVAIFAIIFIRDKTKTKKHFNNFAKRSILAYIMYGGIVILLISPVMFYQDTWIWKSFGGEVFEDDNGLGHLQYEGSVALTNLDITFKFRDGLDLDGNKPATNVASITGGIYSANPGLVAAYWDHWAGGYIERDDFMDLTTMELIDTFTATNGIVTTTSNQYSSGDIVYVEAGTYNAAEDGNYPLKSQWYKAKVQKGNDPTDASVNLGLYNFDFYTPPDDDEITYALVTDTHGAISSTTLDWSDEGDDVVETKIHITFGDDDALMRSYYDRANDRWYDWYIVGTVSEKNCTTSEALTLQGVGGIENGELAISNTFNFYVKLSTGTLFTNNVIPSGSIGYLSDQAGNEHDDYPANWYIDLDFNLAGCTSAGGTDNYQELLITMDGGTWYNTVNLLNAGAISADTTANNFKQDFASTYYICT